MHAWHRRPPPPRAPLPPSASERCLPPPRTAYLACPMPLSSSLRPSSPPIFFPACMPVCHRACAWHACTNVFFLLALNSLPLSCPPPLSAPPAAGVRAPAPFYPTKQAAPRKLWAHLFNQSFHPLQPPAHTQTWLCTAPFTRNVPIRSTPAPHLVCHFPRDCTCPPRPPRMPCCTAARTHPPPYRHTPRRVPTLDQVSTQHPDTGCPCPHTASHRPNPTRGKLPCALLPSAACVFTAPACPPSPSHPSTHPCLIHAFERLL